VVPFKYVLAFFMFDQFTRELEFRREMVKAFMSFMKERWESIHAAPVVVLPYEDGGEQHNKTLPPKSTQQTQSGSVQSTDTYMNLSNGTYTLDI
jgi:hypothetical protein